MVANDELDQHLLMVFSKINEWLKFAEGKNGALIVANVTMLSSIIGFLGKFVTGGGTWKGFLLSTYILGVVVLLFLGVIVSFCSFFPRTSISVSERNKELDDANLLLFSHIATFTPDIYLKNVIEKYDFSHDDSTQLSYDLAQQNVVNSQTALWKYNCFTLALFMTVSGFLTPVLSYLLFKCFFGCD